MNRYLALVAFALVTFAASSTGAIFPPGAWYAALVKPEWTPPNWVFPLAWGVLYVIIALAGWLAWRVQGFGVSLKFWVAQLIFNAAWSYIMFGQHQIGLAMLDIVLLWLMTVGFIVTVWTSSRAAGLLFLPYLAWATFAGALNFAVWQLNPGGLR